MIRKSRQKEAILKVLRCTKSHPTADWVYEQVRKEIPNVSLGTVYRNLKLMQAEGEIMELDFAGLPNRFDANAQNHYHFRCEECGRVFDLDVPVDSSLNREMAKRTGFRISSHRLEFQGLCTDCQDSR